MWPAPGQGREGEVTEPRVAVALAWTQGLWGDSRTCPPQVVDKWYKTNDEEAFAFARMLIAQEGLLCGECVQRACRCPPRCRGSDLPLLGRWQCRQRCGRGREGGTGAAGRSALRGHPARLRAQLHVSHT